MKTESEFQDKLKKRLRHARKGLNPYKMSDNMKVPAGVYFAYERGWLPMTVYQLYKFMHLTGVGPDFIKTIFDDEWVPKKAV